MSRPRLSRTLGAAIAMLVVLATAGSAAAWSNGPSAGGVTGDGYGTHDWIIDQAIKTFGGTPPSWLEIDTARKASDDPDTLFWRTNEHVYMESGYGRGAVYMTTEYYARVINDIKKGDHHQASIDFGRMAHFFADLAVPFHTAYAAVSKTSTHNAYELLVDSRNRTSSSAPEWQTADRSPGPVTDVRALSIALAAYSRAYYPELYKEFTKNQKTMTARASQITGYLLKKASRELGDLLYSATNGIGNPPAAAKVVPSLKYVQPSSIEYQAIYIKVTDASGKPIEGARVDVWWPSSANVPNGAEPTAHVFRAYTMPDGVAKATAYIDLSQHGKKMAVKVQVATRGVSIYAWVAYTAK